MEGCTCESHYLSPYDLFRHKLRKDCPLSLPHRCALEANVQSCSVEGSHSFFRFSLEGLDPAVIFRRHEKAIVDIIGKLSAECPIRATLSASIKGLWEGCRCEQNIYSNEISVSPLYDVEGVVKRMIEQLDKELDDESTFLKRDDVREISYVELKIRQLRECTRPQKRQRLDEESLDAFNRRRSGTGGD
jgi:hypothetical protein